FQPGETGCWACAAQRLRSNRQMERYILDHTDRSNPIITSRAHLAASLALGYNLTAVEATKWLISPKATSLLGKIITVDLYGRKSREHVLVRRPQCPECGHGKDRNQTHPGPLHLVSRKKEFCEDGGHRTHTPRQTYERYKHHISPILGTVTELRPAFGPKSQLVPSYIAGHNFAMGIDSIVFLQESLRGMSGGKGSTEIQAKVSGLCEAIERYSGLYAGDEYRIRGTYADLKPEAIHPNDCMGFSEEQYQHRRKLNVSNPRSRCLLIPDPFDGNLTIDWTPAWSLTGEKFRYLPAAYCYYGHPEFGESRWCNPDSNGSAAGNTLEEAILQGFMELIERDAVALWWYNRIKRPAVDLGSFNLPYVDAILDYYDRLHRRLWVPDITSDLNIATFACISPCSNRPSEDIVLGFGAHFDPKIALLRAITEVNQFLPSILLTNPDGSTQYLFGDDLAVEWWRTARIQDHDYLLPDSDQPSVRYADVHDPSSDDLLTDIDTCIQIARKSDLEFLVLDQTRPDIGLNVVKVAIPEICHFWRRLGKARLYNVPVKQGWLDAPLSPDRLNPKSIFF
ncbi:MAG: TOMM precursor leader peptide-binding protein, partial [bacterium]|nr:TOMM precursor leader peptide-binding protein [bacterium]